MSDCVGGWGAIPAVFLAILFLDGSWLAGGGVGHG